jgi:hypothetical protein
MFARAYEQRVMPTPTPPPKTTSRFFTKSTPTPDPSLSALRPAASTPANSVASVNGKSAPSALRLTLAEIAQRRKEGRCFHCPELFTQGHKDVCPHLYVLEVVAEEEEAEQQAADDPTISLHALIGIQPRSGRMMQLPVVINKVILIALLDSGSTHNFVDTEVAARVGMTL